MNMPVKATANQATGTGLAMLEVLTGFVSTTKAWANTKLPRWCDEHQSNSNASTHAFA